MANMERPIWEEKWLDLQAQLARQDARLAVAEVPEDLISALRDISETCFRDYRWAKELDPDQYGILTELLDSLHLTHRAIRAYLLNEDTKASRRELRERAIAAKTEALEDYAESNRAVLPRAAGEDEDDAAQF
jgi:hypothetical protein